MKSLHRRRVGIVLAAVLLAALAFTPAHTADGQAVVQAQVEPAQVPVGGKIEADNACYVRLPDLPAARYGGVGAYNPDTGVLAYAGGAQKFGPENTLAFYDLFAIKLNGAQAEWQRVPYNRMTGFTQENDKGCREMFSLQLPSKLGQARWLSIMGKDGCDNGAFDTKKKGGDIKELALGTDAGSVAWVPGSRIYQLIGDLVGAKGKLARAFATYDSTRGRVIFGQGTFDDEIERKSQDEVYQARQVGNKWKLTELFPAGPIPQRRFGSCAAYVYDKDTGVDGVFVLSGHSGGMTGTVTFKEVWWLDFSGNPGKGEWTQITDRFSNMDDIGYRREGACAYNPDTKQFYSWMGRANAKVPDGAKRSGGVWRVDLSTLGGALSDPANKLTWERLAKDNLAGIEGRRLVPSVYDWQNNRLFAIGGRNGLATYEDVWAIYPDVTGAACQSLDPYAPFPIPTPVPLPTRPSTLPAACPFITNKVPPTVITAALANPTSVEGYDQLVRPGVPESPFNPRRVWLSVRNPSVPWHPLFNALAFKAGCP